MIAQAGERHRPRRAHRIVVPVPVWAVLIAVLDNRVIAWARRPDGRRSQPRKAAAEETAASVRRRPGSPPSPSGPRDPLGGLGSNGLRSRDQDGERRQDLFNLEVGLQLTHPEPGRTIATYREAPVIRGGFAYTHPHHPATEQVERRNQRCGAASPPSWSCLRCWRLRGRPARRGRRPGQGDLAGPGRAPGPRGHDAQRHAAASLVHASAQKRPRAGLSVARHSLRAARFRDVRAGRLPGGARARSAREPGRRLAAEGVARVRGGDGGGGAAGRGARAALDPRFALTRGERRLRQGPGPGRRPRAGRGGGASPRLDGPQSEERAGLWLARGVPAPELLRAPAALRRRDGGRRSLHRA